MLHESYLVLTLRLSLEPDMDLATQVVDVLNLNVVKILGQFKV